MANADPSDIYHRGQYFNRNGQGAGVDAAGSRLSVPPGEQLAALAPGIVRDLTTTRQKFLYPSGALWVMFSYRLLPGATAVTNQFARVVINASSDADADGKLAADGSFRALCQGDDLAVSAPLSEPITRVDIIASAAVGAEKTLFLIDAGVVA